MSDFARGKTLFDRRSGVSYVGAAPLLAPSPFGRPPARDQLDQSESEEKWPSLPSSRPVAKSKPAQKALPFDPKLRRATHSFFPQHAAPRPATGKGMLCFLLEQVRELNDKCDRLEREIRSLREGQLVTRDITPCFQKKSMKKSSIAIKRDWFTRKS